MLFRSAAYYRIAAHYAWALDVAFRGDPEAGVPPAQRVVVLEDDMELAPDFFEYFAALAPLLSILGNFPTATER